jgi:hypothetical protein
MMNDVLAHLTRLALERAGTLLIVGAFAWGVAAAALTPKPVTVIYATPTPPLPTPVQIDARANAVTCYAAPGGEALGDAPPGALSRVVSRLGDWVQAAFDGIGGYDGQGGCWVRNDDLPAQPPRDAPQHPYSVAYPAAAPPPLDARAPRDAPTPAPPRAAPTLPPQTAATVVAIWGDGSARASRLPPGVDPLAGCCAVAVTPADD